MENKGEIKLKTIYFKGYHASEGTTTINQFWGDVHVLSFRADQVINDHKGLGEVIERFEKDRQAFDRTLYNGHAEIVKADRIYENMVPKEKSLDLIVFEFKGKTYRTITSKWSKIREIEKNADKILEHKELLMEVIENDRTGEIVAKGKIIREINKLEFEDLI